MGKVNAEQDDMFYDMDDTEIDLPPDDEDEVDLPPDDEDIDLPPDDEDIDLPSDNGADLPSDSSEGTEDTLSDEGQNFEDDSGVENMPEQGPYDVTVSTEEQLANSLAFTCPVKISLANIPVEQLIVSYFKKRSRENTVIGLTSIIEKWGIVQPINVLKLEDDKQYIVLDGLRRLFGAIKNGFKEVECRVWDFEDKTEGKKMANILSLMLTRTERYTPQEQWNMMQVLEEVNDLDPGMIEYLTQMASGDAMKLKDIMTCTDYFADDIRQKLLSGSLTIDAAYKKLANERKKEDKLSKEDNTSLGQLANGSGAIEDIRSNSDRALDDGDEGGADDRPAETFSNEEVAEMLELTKSGMDEAEPEYDENGEPIEGSGGSQESLESLNKTDEIRGSDMHQKVGQRHPVSKGVRQGTFMRDGFKCRCCNMGGNESYLSVLAFHHAVPVYLGGPDTIENGLTLCVTCHILLHNYLMGELQVQLDKLDEHEQTRFRNVFKYGNLALEAQKRKGISMDKAKEKYRQDSGAKHPMPNANLAENRKALAEATEAGFTFDNIVEADNTIAEVENADTTDIVDNTISNEVVDNTANDPGDIVDNTISEDLDQSELSAINEDVD